MPLPKIMHPIFKLEIPSTKKTVSYRPYTVQEEKLLLIVRMTEDLDEAIDTVKQVINNCVLDEIDVDSLAMFDIEYIFVNLRKASVSDVVELVYSEDDKTYPFSVNLNDVKVKFDPNHTKNIDLGEGLGVMMKYPSLDKMLKIEFDLKMNLLNDKLIDGNIFDLIKSSIDYVYDDSTVYKEFTEEELEEFLMNLKIDSLDKIQHFFKTIPQIEHTIHVDVNGTKKDITLRGMKDFFSF